MPLYHASVEMSFIADAGAKILKNATFLLVMMPCGGELPTRDLDF